MKPANNYSLIYDGRVIPLQAIRHDHAALEALNLLGARIVSHRGDRPEVAHDITLTMFALQHRMTLSTRRLECFKALPRPVTVDYLSLVRLPERALSDQLPIAGVMVPFLLYVAKILNCDDGTTRPYHEWQARRAEIDARLLATSPFPDKLPVAATPAAQVASTGETGRARHGASTVLQ